MDVYSRVAQHHLREGQMLTQTQEELILIGGFGLLWLGTPVLVFHLSIPPSPPSLSFTCLSVKMRASVRKPGSMEIVVNQTYLGFAQNSHRRDHMDHTQHTLSFQIPAFVSILVFLGRLS